MRTGIAYTSARILIFGISVLLLHWAGAQGFLLLGLAFLISALASYILLNKQRQVLAEKLNQRLNRVGKKATEFRDRLDAGTAAEDEDSEGDGAGMAGGADAAPATGAPAREEPVR